jgi:hypothetical protein
LKKIVLALISVLLLSAISFQWLTKTAGYNIVIDSDQTWTGNTVINALQDLLIRDCTLTIVDGNVTVYGNLTLENVQIIIQTASRSSYLFVSEHGNLTVHNTTIVSGPQNYYLYCSDYSKVAIYESDVEYQDGDDIILCRDNSEVEIYDSELSNIESRNNSKVRVVRSGLNSTYAFDDSIQDFNELKIWWGRAVGWGNYWCPRLSFYNCTYIPAIEATNTTLEIAHTKIGTLQTQSNVKITFDNMTVTDNWTHNGMLYWYAGRAIGWGNYWSIEWGETYASCILEGVELVIEKIERAGVPSVPIPIGKVATGNYINLTVQGEFTAQIRIHYTDEQVAKIKRSTLNLYSYSPDSGWEKLEITGVNTAEKYVWGNITATQEVNMCFAALGRYLTDVNEDGKIDIKDIYLVAKAFGSTPEHPRWNPDADIDENQKIDIRDIYALAKDFGKTY